MGVDYYIINKVNMTSFDIGRSLYYNLDREKDWLIDHNLLLESVKKTFDFDDEYNVWLYDKIIKFVSNIRDVKEIDIIPDFTFFDNEFNVDYDIVGSRYTCEWNGDEFIGPNAGSIKYS